MKKKYFDIWISEKFDFTLEANSSIICLSMVNVFQRIDGGKLEVQTNDQLLCWE